MKHHKSPSDEYLDVNYHIDASFKRFDASNDMFNRAVWDDKVDPKKFFISYDIANYAPKKAKGFDHWDYALRNASWHLTDHVGERLFSDTGRVEGFSHTYTTHTPGPPRPVVIKDALEAAKKIKAAAKLFGAGDVGITNLDRRWVYSHRYNRKYTNREELSLDNKFQSVIVMVLPMDYELGRTFPSALSGSTTGVGYADSLQAATMLAQFITNLGFEALASLNDTALNIPLAIKAGLGEYGRHGLLISRKFGPNVRLAKVITDMPLSYDSPVNFGVREFCSICRKCTNSCPPRAIPEDDPQASPPNKSSLMGIKKWTVDAEKCFKYWVAMNTDCAICIRVCPYNKDYRKWYHRWGRKLAGTPLRKIMLWLDGVLKYGKRFTPQAWWINKIKNA